MRGRRHVHLIGVQGAGMSALARLFIETGACVTGSDKADGERLRALRGLGADVGVGHAAENVGQADLVVFSPAVPRDNVELKTARKRGLVIRSRAGALADLLQDRDVVGVAGSHGKTTTTAMLVAILEQGGYSPGFMIGAAAPASGDVNARWSEGSLFVSESCEAFRALDHVWPTHCLVTNIDDEHSEHYGGRDRLEAAFAAMVARTRQDGHIVLCGDDPLLSAMAERLGSRAITYGLGDNASWRAGRIERRPGAVAFDVVAGGRAFGRIRLNFPGAHNAGNALGALVMANALGVPFDAAVLALERYIPVGRRWEQVGEADGVRVFDDFAHHPTEIAATLAAARDAAGDDGKVVVVVEPLSHARIRRLAAHYARALAIADYTIVLPVDGSGEAPPADSTDALLHDVFRRVGLRFSCCDGATNAAETVATLAGRGDVVVTMGAGLAQQCGSTILAAISERKQRGGQPVAAAVQPPVPAMFVDDPERLHSRFERMAKQRPSAPCVIDGGTTWTYADIARMSDLVAHEIVRRGLRPDDIVVLRLKKSARLLALMIGVLKAGCAFAPIDPKMERPGIDAALMRAGAALAITDETPRRSVLSGVEGVDIECFWNALGDATPPPCPATSRNLAYAIFTSGSTGECRLVGVEHRNVTNVISYAVDELILREDLALAPFIDSVSFDASVHQIFTTFAHGGALLIEHDLASLLRSKHAAAITALGATPSVLQRLIDAAALPPSLRLIMLGGEAIPASLVARLRESGGRRRALNFYGPSETTIYSTVARLLDADASRGDNDVAGRVVGFPIRDTRIHLVDENGRPVADGETGEIIIAGRGVARGYLGDPALTKERFGADIFSSRPGEKIYRTGDVGRRLADGSLEFIGRKDSQLKINGVRFEPIEIERQLEACPGIDRAAVVLSTQKDGPPRLVAYVTAAPGVDLSRLHRELETRLPKALTPGLILRAPDLPLTVGGKLDRRRLAEFVPLDAMLRPAAPPRDDVERRLLDIWRKALRTPVIGVDDDFFELGGDSLIAMTLALAVENAFEIRLPVAALEELTTAAHMASVVRSALNRDSVPPSGAMDDFETSLRKIRNYVAGWKGVRRTPDSLIVTLNETGARDGLFWCFQAYPELVALACELGREQPVHGMRSAHLAFEYRPDTIGALARLYAQEIMSIQPEGALALGGNCQGGLIARATAFALRAQGRRVDRLILMEQGAYWPYDQRVDLIFGEDSAFNPRRRLSEPDLALREAYAGGYALHFISGAHGQFFLARNIGCLAGAIRSMLDGRAEGRA